MKPLLIQHLEGENIGRFPVWMMRQAGRYLESYRNIRKNHSFWEMVKTPELAAEVSLLPVQELPVDAVIFFSDILTLPYGLGLPIEMRESVGPVLEKPLRSLRDFDIFETFNAKTHTPYVGQALQLIRKAIPSEVALLGFAGAPWTVGSYLIEGRSNRHFENIKGWLYQDPSSLFRSMDRLASATIDYLKLQAASGVHAIQLFDTWLCEMPRNVFVNLYVPLLNHIFDQMRSENIKLIYFAKGASHLTSDFKSLNCDLLSVDSLKSLTEVEKETDAQFSLQGNLDPIILLKSDVSTVRRKTRELVQTARELQKPAILNLGHGILPKTPVENAKAFLEEARALWL